MITNIEGRDTDILITPKGKYVTFYFFAGYFEFLNYIDLFQLIQTELNRFHLKLVVNKHFKQDYLKILKKDILEVLGNDVKLEFEIVEDIPLTSSGKRRFFIRDKRIPLTL